MARSYIPPPLDSLTDFEEMRVSPEDLTRPTDFSDRMARYDREMATGGEDLIDNIMSRERLAEAANRMRQQYVSEGRDNSNLRAMMETSNWSNSIGSHRSHMSHLGDVRISPDREGTILIFDGNQWINVEREEPDESLHDTLENVRSSFLELQTRSEKAKELRKSINPNINEDTSDLDKLL